MAKQIGSIQFKGKIGETVGFTGMRGQAFLRKTNATVKNPRTTGQNVQRMILATVGTSIGHLSEVLNSSVQGKSRGAETLAYLRGEWMRQLRVQNIFDASNTLRYAVKGYSGFTPNPYILSKGTLYGPATTMSQQYLAMNSDDLTAPDAVKTATQLFPTIALGDQITLIACYKESGAAPYYNEQPISVAYLRFAFKDDSVPALITNEDTTLRLNPDAIDLSKAAGAWRSVIVRNDGTGVGAFDMTRISRGDIVAGALLVSNLEGNKRSTSYLSVNPNANLYWSASIAEPTFGNNATPLDFASDIYLNNSAVIEEDSDISGVVSASLPAVVTTESDLTFIVRHMPAEPTEVYLDFVQEDSGIAKTSLNLVNLEVGDEVVDFGSAQNDNVTVGGVAWSVTAGEGEYSGSVNLHNPNADYGCIIVGGHMVIAGQTYTF